MFFTDKKKEEFKDEILDEVESIAIHYDKHLFEQTIDVVNNSLDDLRNELIETIYNLISAISITSKIKPKDIAKNYDMEKIKAFQIELLEEVGERINREKEILRKKLEEGVRVADPKPKKTAQNKKKVK